MLPAKSVDTQDEISLKAATYQFKVAKSPLFLDHKIDSV
jgi:hypothetical protein